MRFQINLVKFNLHVELEIPRGDSINLYATGGGDIFLKTVGGKRKLNHQEAMAEILRRNK